MVFLQISTLHRLTTFKQSLFSSLFVVPCLTLSLWMLKLPLIRFPVENFCIIFQRVKIISFGFAIACSYLALWYRVFFVFYRNAFLLRKMNKSLKLLPFIPIMLLILMEISTLYAFLSGSGMEGIKCGYRKKPVKKIDFIKWAMLIFYIIAFQTTLLVSFVYPLYLHKRKMLNRGFDHRSNLPIGKAAIVASICAVSDLLNFSFAVAYKGNTIYVNHVVVSINLLVIYLE